MIKINKITLPGWFRIEVDFHLLYKRNRLFSDKMKIKYNVLLVNKIYGKD